MRNVVISLACFSAVIFQAASTQAGIPTSPDPHTAAAVRSADDAWAAAEEAGDAAFVDWLLLPGYQSVGANGKATSKAAIVAHTTQILTDPHARGARAAAVAAWKANHPSQAVVTLYGTTAVLTWVSAGASGKDAVYSCDIFFYREGHWRAIYSQHTAA
jgi:hypothetical protein